MDEGRSGTSDLEIVSANEATCDDLQAVFGIRGAAVNCQCQRYKLRPREAFARFPVEERARRLREQTRCGHPESETTSGLVARLDGEPVGWCAVEPRTAFTGLLRNNRVPWEGREEDKADDSVWAVTCVFTRRASAAVASRTRSRGRASMSRGAAAHARSRASDTHVTGPEDQLGRDPRRQPQHLRGGRLRGGSHPTLRRVVMRIDF